MFRQLVFILHSVLQHRILGQQICDGTETFEKITGVNVLAGSYTKTELVNNNGSSGTITALCNNKCREKSDCRSFLLDYDSTFCHQLETNSDDNRDLIISSDKRTAYFEKICLRAPACEKAWIYERAVGYLIEGYDDRVIAGVTSRQECEELCLIETEFACASAEYFYSQLECRLSKDTRRSQPASFRAGTENVDYLENQCIRERLPESCQYEKYEDQDIGYADIQLSARNSKECGDLCDQTSAFNCRSYTYFPSSSLCRLSGDDNVSAGPGALIFRTGAEYFQRGPCVELSLECRAESMTVTLNTEEPFTGRLFSQGGSKCQTLGTARTETSLTFEYDQTSRTKCGVTSEESGVVSAVVVVQHHPVIQRKGDKAIQLLCYFEATDKVVTNGYDVITDTIDGLGPSPVSILNATAATPAVRLRITSENGEDISGTRIGEKLLLKIELAEESIFGMFARNLVAFRGDNEESIELLDDRGCPTEPVIFSGLEKIENSNNLQGSFEAFKFSETSLVRFQVSVQFCVGECKPVNCDDGIVSFGRRRRDTEHSLINGEEDLVFDEKLNQQVLDIDTNLVKEIFVQSGTTIERLTTLEDFEDKDQSGGGSVFIRGEHVLTPDSDVVCTTWPVVLAASAGVVFLQLCIIATCLTCLYTSHKQLKQNSLYTRKQNMKSNNNSSIYPQPLFNNERFSTLSSNTSRLTENSSKTIRSLRTSLRD